MELNDAVLMSAIKRDDVEAIQKSFKRIDDVSNYVFEASVSSTNPVLDDHPPLVSVAAFFGASSILLDLLSKGVDISKRDDKHRSLGYFAVAGSRLSIVKLLAESHVDFSECGHLAAGLDNLEILKFLILDLGLDPLTTDAFGCTFLHSAATSGTAAIADFLLSLNVIDVNPRDHEGNTPLHLAAYNGNTPVVNLLLKHPDVDLNPTNNKAKSILHLAAQKKNESLIQSILESAGIGSDAKPTVSFSFIGFVFHL